MGMRMVPSGRGRWAIVAGCLAHGRAITLRAAVYYRTGLGKVWARQFTFTSVHRLVRILLRLSCIDDVMACRTVENVRNGIIVDRHWRNVCDRWNIC